MRIPWLNVRWYGFAIVLTLALLTLLLVSTLVFSPLHQAAFHLLASGPNVIDHSH